MVTPSLVIVGEPNCLASTTLRPLGPRVTLTESASLLTPRSRARRACVLNASILAAMSSFRTTAVPLDRTTGGRCYGRRTPTTSAPGTDGRPGRTWEEEELLLEDGEDVPGVEDQVLLAAVLHLSAAVLAVEDGVPDG